MYWTLLSGFFDICLLRRSPADLPASNTLAALTTGVFFLLSCASEWLGQEPSYFPSRPLFSVITSFAIVAGVLQFAGFTARLKQTWIAFTGCGALISLMVFPLALSIRGEGGDSSGTFPMTALAILALLIWSIVVDAHIFRQAIGSTLSAGLAIATLTFSLLLVLRVTMFP